MDAPHKRLYNNSQFIEIDTRLPVTAADTRKTKGDPTLTGLGVLKSIKNPYDSKLFTNPIALPPAFKKGNCTQLIPYAQRLHQLFTTNKPDDAVNTILDTFVKKATELQTTYNSTARSETGIPVESFNSLLRPFLGHFGEEVPADSQMEGFLLLLQVVKKKVSSMISKAHPDIQLVQKIEEELNERSRNWLGDGMKKKKVFNIGSVMRTFAYARALVWIATDYPDRMIPKDLAVVREGLGFHSGSIVKLICGWGMEGSVEGGTDDSNGVTYVMGSDWEED